MAGQNQSAKGLASALEFLSGTLQTLDKAILKPEQGNEQLSSDKGKVYH